MRRMLLLYRTRLVRLRRPEALLALGGVIRRLVVILLARVHFRGVVIGVVAGALRRIQSLRGSSHRREPDESTARDWESGTGGQDSRRAAYLADVRVGVELGARAVPIQGNATPPRTVPTECMWPRPQGGVEQVRLQTASLSTLGLSSNGSSPRIPRKLTLARHAVRPFKSL